MATGTPRHEGSAGLWLDRLRANAPLAATALGVLYASGFVVVNAYLGGYGIRELDALRTRYVGAGLLFVVFVALAAVVAGEILEDARGRVGRRRLVIAIVAVIVSPWLMALFEVLILVRISSGAFGTAPVDLETSVRVYAMLALTNVALVIAFILFEVARTDRRSVLLERVTRGFTSWWLVLAILAVAVAWAEEVYPHVPAFLGGGRPEPVRLVTTPSVAEACPPCVDRDVLLIDADERRIVILATDTAGRRFAVEIFPVSGNDRAVIHMPR